MCDPSPATHAPFNYARNIASEPRWGLIEKPGLGVEVDEVRLKQYADLYRLQGQYLPWAAADND